jgi:hypothetical protein
MSPSRLPDGPPRAVETYSALTTLVCRDHEYDEWLRRGHQKS